jgi:nucleolar protein 6
MKSKKLRKAERKAAESLANDIAQYTPFQDAGVASNEGDKAGKSKRKNRGRKTRSDGVNCKTISSNEDLFAQDIRKKPARFIVFIGKLGYISFLPFELTEFIGNLPFSTTTESIKEHFAAVKPISIRHLTKKGEFTQSKGCAFVEFEGYDHMKTCLRLFHHSTFDNGISPPRKINVELT